MNRIKLSSSIALGLVFLGALGTETWFLLRERQRANRAGSLLQQKITEGEWLAKQAPAPTPQNEQAIAAELTDARQALAALRTTLQGADAGWLSARPPAKPLDAFFDIAGFVEKARAAAVRAKVRVAPNESFGFAAYSTEGPALEFLPQVYRQRLVAQRLLEALFEAHPMALLGLQLEAPVAAVAAEKNRTGDYFSFTPSFPLRQPGQLDTLAFRVEFSGQTAVLRDFLNRVAGFPQPFVVRSVEVEPVTGFDSPVSAKAGPLVRQTISKFAVVVELVLPNATPAQARL